MKPSRHADLVTRWNIPNKDHDAIIIEPPNNENDLILRSRVFVQTFFSLQKHQYHYIAENGSYANGVYCDLRVDWKGPQISFYVSPTRPKNMMVESWFSPQVMKTSVDADAIAGRIPYRARSVVSERANAYVPWSHTLWKAFKDILPDVIKEGLTLNSVLMIGDSNELLRITSQVRSIGDGYAYDLFVKNSKEAKVEGVVSKSRYDGNEIGFLLQPGDVWHNSFENNKPPGEVWTSLHGPSPLQGLFPVALIIPESDM